MTRRNCSWPTLPFALTVCGLAFALGCDGCGCGAPPLAVLVTREGTVERDFANAIETWKTAEAGAEFGFGDGLRTGPNGRAVAHIQGAGSIALRASTAIRFRSRPGDQENPPEVAVEQGEAVLETGDTPVTLSTAMGTAVLEPGTRVAMTKAARGTHYRVELGKAAFEGAGGERIEVESGRAITVGIGLAELEGEARESEATGKKTDTGVPQPTDDLDVGAGKSGGAILATVRGPVRARNGEGADWRDLAEGDNELHANSELRLTESSSRVDLGRGDARARLEGRGHYRIGPSGGPLVSALDGSLSMVAGDHDVVIEVPGGRIIARGGVGGSSANVRVSEDRVQVKALNGKVAARGLGRDRELSAGQEAVLTPANEEATGPGDDSQAPVDDNEERVKLTASLSHRDLTVTAGATFRVYDPRPPTAIAFNLLKKCPQQTAIRMHRHLYGGGIDGHVVLNVTRGTHPYTAHCVTDGVLGKIEKRGRVRVMRSDGTRKMPNSAPKSVLAVDGRHYTVTYQSIEPTIVLSWPRAPAASKYTLHLRSGETRRKFATRKPRIRLRSGTLKEGDHQVFFAAHGTGGKRSKETTVQVAFDNAAPSAHIESPPPRGFRAGSTVKVAGTALPGSRVSVHGKDLAVDSQHRFSGRVKTSASQRALSVRIAHKRSGIRYYLRRASNSR